MNLEPAKKEVLYYRPQKISLDSFQQKLACVFENRWFTNSGPMESELADSIATLHGVKHCVLLANATLALLLTTRALKLRGRVITTPFSFVATTQALMWEGLEPVYVDIDPDHWTISPKAISAALHSEGNGISGILGVHVFGTPCQAEEIDQIAADNGIVSFYDAAHCFGVQYKGKSVGSFGQAEILSFHATKIFQTFEGGAVLTNDSVLASKIEKMRNFGFDGLDSVDSLGINAKMNEVSAAYGLSLLPHIQRTIEELSEIHQSYRAKLKGVTGISCTAPLQGLASNNQYFPILIDQQSFQLSRDEVWAALWAKGIQTRRYFFPMLSDVHARLTGAASKSHLPNSKYIAESVLCLPCYVDLDETALEEIAMQIISLQCNKVTVRKWYLSFLNESAPIGTLAHVHRALNRERTSKCS